MPYPTKKGEQERLSIGNEEGANAGSGFKFVYTKLNVSLVLTVMDFVGI